MCLPLNTVKERELEDIFEMKIVLGPRNKVKKRTLSKGRRGQRKSKTNRYKSLKEESGKEEGK